MGRERTKALAESMAATQEKVAATVMKRNIPPIPPPVGTGSFGKALWPGLNKHFDKSYNALEGGDMAMTATEKETIKTLLETTCKTMTTEERRKHTDTLIEATITKMALLDRIKNASGK